MKINVKDFEHSIRSAKNNITGQPIFTGKQIETLKTIFRFECDKMITDKIQNEELIELPYAIGEKIYYVDYDAQMIDEIRISHINILRCDGKLRVYAFDTLGNGGLISEDGEFFYATKEQAEARLKELRGEI